MTASPSHRRGTPADAGRPGLRFLPFRGLRFDPARIADPGQVTCPPYDVIEADGITRFEASHEYNVIRLILPHAEDPSTRHEKAAEALHAWVADGMLVRDADPALYVYEQRSATAVQRGLIGCVGLHPPEDRVVLPHEEVMPGPVEDRLGLMRATEANLEPILLTYEGGGPASDAVERTVERTPLLSADTDDGLTHRLWAITEPHEIDRIAEDLYQYQALIADGNHRYATYLRLRAEHHDAGRGAGPWDCGLALLVDSTRHPLEVRAIHRVIHRLRPESAVELASRAFTVTEFTPPGTWSAADPDHRLNGWLGPRLSALATAGELGTAFLVTGGGRSWLLTEPDPTLVDKTVRHDRPDAWRGLDTVILHELLLGELWQIPDTQTDITYHHYAGDAAWVAASEGSTAVLLNPVTEGDVLALARQGQRMPRKTTSFGPKPRNGFVLRTLAEE